MNTNKGGMGGHEQHGRTGVLEEEKKHNQGGKDQGKGGEGQQKPDQSKQEFRYQDKGGKTEHGKSEQPNEQKK
jgi:hypothetical protein